MRALGVYESLFGNTAQVAEAIAGGLRAARPGAVAVCAWLDDAPPARDVDLLVVGGLGLRSPWRTPPRPTRDCSTGCVTSSGSTGSAWPKHLSARDQRP